MLIQYKCHTQGYVSKETLKYAANHGGKLLLSTGYCVGISSISGTIMAYMLDVSEAIQSLNSNNDFIAAIAIGSVILSVIPNIAIVNEHYFKKLLVLDNPISTLTWWSGITLIPALLLGCAILGLLGDQHDTGSLALAGFFTALIPLGIPIAYDLAKKDNAGRTEYATRTNSMQITDFRSQVQPTHIEMATPENTHNGHALALSMA